MQRKFFLAASTALLIGLSFPPLPLGFLAYFAIVPFYLLISKLSFSDGFRWGYITGVLISLTTIYWIVFPTVTGSIAAILVHGLYYALLAMAFLLVERVLNDKALWTIPFLWTALEYIKSIGELGFPWVTIGYSQAHYLDFIQFSDITSVYGVSFWVVLINMVFVFIYQSMNDSKKVVTAGIAIVLLFALPLIYANLIKSELKAGAETITVAVVQGNIDPYQKYDSENIEKSFAIYEKLTRSIGKDSVDVIIWPETATPTFLLKSRKKLPWAIQLVKDLNTPLLTGTPDYEWINREEYKTYNSITLIDDTSGRYDSYRKTRLVPFGERVPYLDMLYPIKYILEKFNMGEGNFSPGNELKLFNLPNRRGAGPDVKIGGVICFESTFPELVADFVRMDANFIVILTNDAWFERTGAPYQHAQMAVFRAIENRVSIARSANTGVSMTIDPYGRIRKRTGIFEQAVFKDSLSLRTKTSFFSQFGHVFAHIITSFTIGLIVICGIYVQKNKKAKSGALHK